MMAGYRSRLVVVAVALLSAGAVSAAPASALRAAGFTSLCGAMARLGPPGPAVPQPGWPEPPTRGSGAGDWR